MVGLLEVVKIAFLPVPLVPNQGIGHFTVVYSVTRPMNGSEAAGDHVFII